ncbi:MAG: DNA-directed RNA polymerase subunit omega [Gloeobacterales cyanobacterium]
MQQYPLVSNPLIRSYTDKPIDPDEVMERMEALIEASSNRYRIVVQIANRAKRRRYEELDGDQEISIKPVIRTILEMSDELNEPEIIGD